MCSDFDTDPYLIGQGHMRHLKVKVHMLVSALKLIFALMDYNLTWYKCCPHLDNVQWPWPGSIPQRSKSHKTFNGQSTHACVRVRIDGLPSNLVQMLSLLRQCTYIQEYLGYQSNNLYFLFSHSWPVVVYNYGQVQRTRLREKQNVLKKQRWEI